MYKTILAPLDSTRFGEEALGAAVSIARRAHAKLCLATVEIAPAFFPESYDAQVARGAAGTYLDEVSDRIHEASVPALEVETEVLTGSIPDALEKLRDEIDADLVVMATHGRGPVSRAWLGSTADALLRATTAPLLLIRPEDVEVSLGDSVDFRRILVAYDGSETSEAVLEPVFELGKLFGASYHIIRVVEFPHGIPSVYLPDISADNKEYLDAAKVVAEREVKELVERLRDKDLSVESSVVIDARIADGILSTAAKGDFDLIAIATHGRGGVRRMVLGSVADKVIRGADLPVLVVRPSD